jgi:hypothetical protein|tara:strand:+ start:2039 stop:2227 length:189 start_codon:yes stop_codon:yes gene_type:complete
MNRSKVYKMIASILIAIAIWPIAVLIVATILFNIIPAMITIGLIGYMAYSIYKGLGDDEPFI